MLRKKTAEIALAAICALLTLLTLFLVTLSLIFTIGKGAPNIFGKSAYLVKTDAFEVIKNPSAVLAEKTVPEKINPGNIIIFTLENAEKKTSVKAIGEVRGKTGENGVTYFTVADENGKEHVVASHLVIAKAVKTSMVMGVLINFAVSPAGLLVIAVLPCLAILLTEAAKPILLKKELAEKIEPVNKQDETPTFVPKTKPAPVKSESPPKPARETAPEKTQPPFMFNIEEKSKPVKPAREQPSSVKLAQAISLVKTEKENAGVNINKPIEPSRPVSAEKPPPQTKSIEEILAIYAARTGKAGKGGT